MRVPARWACRLETLQRDARSHDARFKDDLGAAWLDRVELIIAIEDQFDGVEITDDQFDKIEVVGDLIRCVEEMA